MYLNTRLTIKRIDHPIALLRYGLFSRVELRLQANYYTQLAYYIPQTLVSHLLDPVGLGIKLRLWEQQGILPKTALITSTGNSIFSK